MKSSICTRAAGLAVSAFAGICCAQPTDSFHLMQIEQVIGRVGGDATKQAIQLRERTSFQNLLSNSRMYAFDAAGLNPVLILDMTTNVTGFNGGDNILIASPGFSSSTTPACVPDFVMTNPIPASYLNAGRITFEDDFGTIYWSLSWGGAAYTGSNAGSLTNDADGNFGPPFNGTCPSPGLQALRFTGPFSAPSTSNSADYAVTAGPAVFRNNAGTTFTVIAAPPVCYADCDHVGGLTGNDFQCFLDAFVSNSTYANCDAVGGLTANDFQCFLDKFVAGCS